MFVNAVIDTYLMINIIGLLQLIFVSIIWKNQPSTPHHAASETQLTLKGETHQACGNSEQADSVRTNSSPYKVGADLNGASSASRCCLLRVRSIGKSGFRFSKSKSGFPNRTRNPKTDFTSEKSVLRVDFN